MVSRMMTKKEADVYAAIIFAEEQRKKAKRFPLTVLRREIVEAVGSLSIDEVNTALQSLVEKGKIKKSQAIHEDCYTLNEK